MSVLVKKQKKQVKYFNSVQAFGQDDALSQFSSSWKQHTWKPGPDPQHERKVCSSKTFSPICPCTYLIWVENRLSCCRASHEQLSVQLQEKLNLLQVEIFLFVWLVELSLTNKDNNKNHCFYEKKKLQAKMNIVHPPKAEVQHLIRIIGK